MQAYIRQLDDLWLWRRSGEVDRAERAHLDLRQQVFGHAPTNDIPHCLSTLISMGFSPCEAASFLTFKAATLTRHGEVDASDRLLQEIIRVCADGAYDIPYQVHLQAGLNSLSRADYLRAIACFRKAGICASSSFERIAAKANQVFAMENLGYELGTIISEIDAELAMCATETWYEACAGQWEAMNFRHLWRLGDLASLQANLRKSNLGAQTNFYYAWLSKLPYMNTEPYQAGIALLSESIDAYMAPYMLNSLLGTLAPSDLEESNRWSDQIERLYLWVWLWLETGHSQWLQKALALKDHILTHVSGVLNSEDSSMLRLSILWLNLFHGKPADTCDLASSRFVYSAMQNTAPLVYEYRVLTWLYAYRDRSEDNEWQQIENHVLHHSEHWVLPQLMRSLRSPEHACPARLRLLRESLRTLRQSTSDLRVGLYVKAWSGELTLVHENDTKAAVISETLSCLIAVFRHASSVDALDLAHSCWGVRRLNELTQQRLTRLLARGNKVTKPFMQFHRRGDRIYAVKQEHRIHWLGFNKHTEQILALCSNNTDRRPTPEFEFAHTSASHPSPDNWIRRQELEKLVGSSRSSTVRKIAEWLRRKDIEKKGIGKSTRYRLKANLIKELTKC